MCVLTSRNIRIIAFVRAQKRSIKKGKCTSFALVLHSIDTPVDFPPDSFYLSVARGRHLPKPDTSHNLAVMIQDFEPRSSGISLLWVRKAPWAALLAFCTFGAWRVETGCTGLLPNANDTTAYPQAAEAESQASKVAASAGVSAEARCLHARIYNDT